MSDFRLSNYEVLAKTCGNKDPHEETALCEMLRMGGGAVVPAEPADNLPVSIFGLLPKRCKPTARLWVGLINAHTDERNYEGIGNYIYTIAKCALEKGALGLNLPDNLTMS